MKQGTLDWAGLMRAGIGGLRLLPRDFWSLTPVELMLLVGGTEAGIAAGATMRDRFEALCAQFPDKEEQDGNG